MARPKKNPEEATTAKAPPPAELKETPDQAANGAQEGPRSGKRTSKMKAVRIALMELGDDASPTDIQNYLKKHFGLDIKSNHASSYKSSILRGSRKARERDEDGESVREEKPVPAANAFDPVSFKRYLKELQALKQLAERVGGVERLREMVDVLALVSS
jgi:hypothetical protein